MSISTWYMEDIHYIGLFKSDYTSMVVPFSTTSDLPIFGTVHYTGRRVDCQYYNYGKPIETRTVYESNKVRWIGTRLPLNGLYSYLLTFNCSSNFESLIDQLTLDVFKSKTVFITVEKGILVHVIKVSYDIFRS